jgi:hypothetical protein
MISTKSIKLVFLKFLIIVLFFWITSNCAFFQHNTFDNQSSLTEKKVILEVTTIASESSYPSGKILDFRLYNNTEVEFDFYPPNTPDRVGMKFAAEKKEAKLSQDDFDKITSFLSKSDLLTADNVYLPRRISPMSIDSSVKKIIALRYVNQEKQIILEENDSHLYLSDAPPNFTVKPNLYPKSLIELLELVNTINKKLRKEIDPESR